MLHVSLQDSLMSVPSHSKLQRFGASFAIQVHFFTPLYLNEVSSLQLPLLLFPAGYAAGAAVGAAAGGFDGTTSVTSPHALQLTRHEFLINSLFQVLLQRVSTSFAIQAQVLTPLYLNEGSSMHLSLLRFLPTSDGMGAFVSGFVGDCGLDSF